MSTRLIQLRKDAERVVALVDEPHLRLLEGVSSIYALANEAIRQGRKLSALAQQKARGGVLDYDSIYEGSGEWRILPAIDHPEEPARCLP